MAVQDPNGDEFFVAIPLETQDHAATVEVAAGMVQLAIRGPVAITRTVLTRAEARDVVLAVIHASQQIDDEEG
jgi:prolyl-tRNA editing enzyme YbaK/EbsC (Cys-tRNA(Pro) deacylase)